MNALEVSALASSAAKCHRFRSSPFLHYDVRLCGPFRDLYGTIILHRGHHGWVEFLSSSITIMYWTFRCQKYTHMEVRVASRTLHPSKGKRLVPSFVVKYIL